MVKSFSVMLTKHTGRLLDWENVIESYSGGNDGLEAFPTKIVKSRWSWRVPKRVENLKCEASLVGWVCNFLYSEFT